MNKQSESFKEKSRRLKEVLSFNSVFKNHQVRKKMSGAPVNYKLDLALTEREIGLVKSDLQDVKDRIEAFEKEL